MFDQQSANLLQSAPELPGILPEDLPRQLTAIYTELVTNRLNGLDPKQDATAITRLIEIATSYEIITALQPSFRGRGAAAFVAGSAYQILSKSLTGAGQEKEPILSRDHIDGRIAAALLFLVAEQYPDAREAIGPLGANRDNMPQLLQMLTESLIDMVTENYVGILERAARREQLPEARIYEPQTRAMLYLYDLNLQGIEQMAALILGAALPATLQNADRSPADVFRTVISAASLQFNNVPFTGGFLSTYPGPEHLASLLLKSADSLLAASIMQLDAPDGTDESIWFNWLRYRAQSKPILWPNHREAFERGFHLPGNSAVMVLPTGAGKTTLSEFKIAATLSCGKKVIFLAPTNALVEQLKNDLSQSLPANLFGDEEFYELDLFITVDDTLSPLEVMTPEKCLALLNFNPQAFADVGLLVFDECHSLSADSGSLRRSIDGMLVVLNLQRQVPGIDMLFLSAMLENGEEFARWIIELTGRECLAIDTVWKPSRQARGIIIYPKNEIDHIEAAATARQHQLDNERRNAGTKRSEAPLKPANDLVLTVPHALFGLVNNWHPDTPEDIRIRRLSPVPYQLKTEFGPLRTVKAKSSGNDVSRNLSVACAAAGLKTIVFINNANWSHTSAKLVGEQIEGTVNYNDREQRLWRAIEQEFGMGQASMLYNMKHAVPHNANLISFERQLAESLYKRPDGAKVIFATTTLSQGMNLPAQVAILSANERASLGVDYVTQEPLKPHELLNAAGRAGRAGYLANGVVILVPRTIVTFIGERPQDEAEVILRSIIPENERCVTLDDPLRHVLDQIQGGVPPNPDIEYVFNRLSDGRADGVLADTTFDRSFAKFRADEQGVLPEFLADVASFKAAMAARPAPAEVPDWLSQIAIQSGISSGILISLYNTLKADFEQFPKTVIDWVNWLLDWFQDNEEAGRYCFGSEMSPLMTVAGVKQIDHENYQPAINILKQGMTSWLTGLPITDIERSIGGDLRGAKVLCSKAREIVTNIAPRGFSFFSTFLVQTAKHIADEFEETIKYPAALECLPAAIKHGFDHPGKLAFYQLNDDRLLTRVEAHQRYNVTHPSFELAEDDDYKMIIDIMRIL